MMIFVVGVVAMGVLSPTLVLAAEKDSAQVSPEVQYREARALFEKGDFKKAGEICRALIAAQHLSPALFELMGHIHYRQENLGEAALWYERAALFSKPSVELRQNIAHIHDRTGSVNFVGNRFRDQYAAFFTRSEWFFLMAGAGWIFVFAVVLYYFSPRRSSRRTFFMLVRVLAVAGMALAALGWYWRPSFEKIHDLATVTAVDTRAYTAAARTSGLVMPNVPPGSNVRRLYERGAWTYVEIPTEQPSRGWVTSDSLSRLWPFDPAYLY
ncbi:hypothetical protein FEM03_05090 [Phragmitibacter flavus]|uniref:Tetratricopeptide repeat protein n=2 Tax=Phragmitibacter flavus TaxID=2576071 RepID=A0A5R8KIG2_9BACT|nr:hypothetical protein FEM03_05090 [Phragmitibacter flavus]